MDPISDMLNMMKNASIRGHDRVVVPFSNIKFAIAECLKGSGYIKEVEKKTKKGFPVLEFDLVYDENGSAKIHGIERISKPSRRMYAGQKDIKPIRSGTGLTILSTPKGILTGSKARSEHVGGEILFVIW
jgi:small subunit ribosomal protein S8